MQGSTHNASSARIRIDTGIVIWASFLAACVATMVFFGLFDPVLLADDIAPPTWLSDRMTAYTIGFFFFWSVCALASGFTAFLVGTRQVEPPAN